MASAPSSKRTSPARACCLAAMAVLGLMVIALAVMIGGGVGVARWWGSERRFLMAEHAAWPKATPLTAFGSKSPGGVLVTRAGKRGGDGLSSHSDKHDCIFLAKASCPASAIEIAAQDHAACEGDWWACRRSDGGLLHESFGVTLRWLDASLLEISWTELTGLDAAGHRTWARRAKAYRIHVTHGASATSCDGVELRAEPLPPAGAPPTPG